MNFKKYASIENHYREKFINLIKHTGNGECLYMVSEKIHGSNLSFLTNGKEVEVAKRSSKINMAEDGTCNFFNAHKVLGKYAEEIKIIFSRIKHDHPETDYIQVYGELFGGHYPHPEVERDRAATKVQNGVWYHPSNEFVVFDIVRGEGEKRCYLDEHEFGWAIKDLELNRAPKLLVGTLDECLAHSDEFESLVPALYGLPAIENNICEGIVIKPIKPKNLPSGQRIIIKKKNDKFKETQKTKKVKRAEETSEQLHEAMEAVTAYITSNRLNSVLSKLGEITSMSQFGMVLKEMNIDVIEDFKKDNGEMYEKLDGKEQKRLNKFIGSNNQPIVKEWMGKNV
jgi:Rnl2 family RNA ligase